MCIEYYHHGRFPCAGGVIPDAVTAYRIYGDPKNPCIVFLTCFGGKLDSKSSHLAGNTATLEYWVVRPGIHGGPWKGMSKSALYVCG